MEQIKPLYVAFDSSVIGDLATLYRADNGQIQDPRLKKKLLDDIKSKGYLTTILQAITSGYIRPVIVNTVFNEISLAEHTLPFIKKFGWFPKITEANRLEKRNRVKKLAAAYCTSFTKDGKTHTSPMKATYNAFADDYTPSNDAFAMAEATIEKCIFVTSNEQDFISYGRAGENNFRANKIIAINIQNGYYTDKPEENFQYAPKPVSVEAFAGAIKTYLDRRNIIQPDDEFVYAGDEIAK